MYTTHCEDPNCKKCRDLKRNSEALTKVVKMAANKQSKNPIVLSPEEENRNKILKSVTQQLGKDLLAATNEKEFYLESFEKVKEEIHNRFGRLTEALRKREQDLCNQVERACREEIEKIHLLTTVQCIDKLMKKDILDRTPFRSKMVFKSEFDYILSELEKFGQLTFEAKKYTDESNLKLLADDVAPSTLLLDPLSTTMSANNDKYQKLAKELEKNLHYMENLTSFRKDSVKRFDDLKILSDLQQCARKTEKLKILTEAQDDTVQQFGASLDSVHCKEVPKDLSMVLINEQNELNKLHEIVKDEGQQIEVASNAFPKEAEKDYSKLEESLKRLTESFKQTKIECMKGFQNHTDVLMKQELESLCKNIKRDRQRLERIKVSPFDEEWGKDDTSDEDDLEIISQSEAATIPSESSPVLPPKNRFRFGRKRAWCSSLGLKKPAVPKDTNAATEQHITEVKPREFIDAFLSNQHEMCCGANAQESSSKWLTNPIPNELGNLCLGGSNTESENGLVHDPSGALRSSFKKYLEKNPEGEWLVNEKSSGQSPLPGNSCIFNGELPFLVENSDQWLSTKQNLVSDWLYSAKI